MRTICENLIHSPRESWESHWSCSLSRDPLECILHLHSIPLFATILRPVSSGILPSGVARYIAWLLKPLERVYIDFDIPYRVTLVSCTKQLVEGARVSNKTWHVRRWDTHRVLTRQVLYYCVLHTCNAYGLLPQTIIIIQLEEKFFFLLRCDSFRNEYNTVQLQCNTDDKNTWIYSFFLIISLSNLHDNINILARYN